VKAQSSSAGAARPQGERASRGMKAVLLIGNFSGSLRPLTLSQPLPLLRFCNRSLIFHQLQALKDAGISQVVICHPNKEARPAQRRRCPAGGVHPPPRRSRRRAVGAGAGRLDSGHRAAERRAGAQARLLARDRTGGHRRRAQARGGEFVAARRHQPARRPVPIYSSRGSYSCRRSSPTTAPTTRPSSS